MKVIFIDLDGVVNNYGLSDPWTRPDGSIQQPVQGTQNDFGGCMGFDYDKVERLNRVFDDSDWSIVISSSWYLTNRTLGALTKWGFRHCHRIVGETLHRMDGRGAQILYYVEHHPRITDFITIEDEQHDITGTHKSVTPEIRETFLDNRLFKPNPYEGLQDELTEEIIKRIKS